MGASVLPNGKLLFNNQVYDSSRYIDFFTDCSIDFIPKCLFRLCKNLVLISIWIDGDCAFGLSVNLYWNLDFIVLNSLRDQGAGFRCDTNKITIIDNAGGVTSYPLKTKREVACDIVNKLVTLLK